MNKPRFLIYLLLVFTIALPAIPQSATAQQEGVAVRYRGVGGQLSPNRALQVEFNIVNQTQAPVIVNGVSFDDVLDVSADGLNLCPRIWFGDAGYNDRPQGEDEQNPPATPYPLQQPQFSGPVQLAPGEDLTLPAIELYMIQAAPNECMGRSIRLISSVDWEFVPTYHPVTGTITDSVTGSPIDTATVTITGITESGVASEEVLVDENGFYSGSGVYQAGTELTVYANAPGYTPNERVISVSASDSNIVDVTLAPIPVTGTVTGTVTDTSTGGPIENSEVLLTGTDAAGNQVSETVYSNASGQFNGTIEYQVGTSVTMSVSAEGYISSDSVIEAVSEGVNNVSIGLSAVQVEEPEQTPTAVPTETETPSPDVTETPSPEATATETPAPDRVETETPAGDSPAATPVPSSPGNPAPAEKEPLAPSQPVVSALPSTGSGGTSSLGLLIGASLTSATAIAVAIRRKNS